MYCTRLVWFGAVTCVQAIFLPGWSACQQNFYCWELKQHLINDLYPTVYTAWSVDIDPKYLLSTAYTQEPQTLMNGQKKYELVFNHERAVEYDS